MTTTSSNAPDIDALLNRAAVSLARSQRLVESWLPQPLSSTTQTPSQTAESAKEELKAVGRPEKLGLGAERLVAGESAGGGGGGAELERLRRVLIGRSTAKRREKEETGQRVRVRKGGEESEDDEMGSRAAVIASKRSGIKRGKVKNVVASGEEDEEAADGVDNGEGQQVGSVPRPGKRPASYLDEVLATRSQKKKKKKRRKEGAGTNTA